jgi:hypothetical protein
MIKLGISVNVFDGYEMLEMNLRFVRPFSKNISIVYQEVSNNIAVINTEIGDVIKHLQSKDLVDDVILYNPEASSSLQEKECEKRNLGLQLAKVQGCTHFLSMDADELYLPALFEEVIEDEGKQDVYFSRIRTYYKFVDAFYDEDPKFLVPFIQKIGDGKFAGNNPRKHLLDATRILPYRTSTILKGIMHHFSYIRTLDFYSKFNSGTNSKNAQKHYAALKKAFDEFSSIRTKALILRNWSHLEEVQTDYTSTITNLLNSYDWDSTKGIYTKRSL